MQRLKIAIGNDHTAFMFKKPIIEYLLNNNYEVLNLGTDNDCPVDYPDFGKAVANAIINKQADLGIVICGTGIGVSIAANKVKGARCALVYEEETARMARNHNNANIIALGARLIAAEKAVNIINTFLNTLVSKEERHLKRIEKLED